MKILDQLQIRQKINRLAYEVVESNFGEKEIILAGINNKGLGFAKMLKKQLVKIAEIDIKLIQLRLDPADPISSPIEIDLDSHEIQGKTIIVVDDVANTGRTMFYAMKVFMDVLPEKVETAVLIDRKHKLFPVEINHFGLSLATTMKEDIQVKLSKLDDMAVYIK